MLAGVPQARVYRVCSTEPRELLESPEDGQRAAQQAYVSLGKPGSLGFFRRVSTTSARLAPLRSPSCLGGQRDVSLDPSGTHEYRRSCGRPCERPPQAAEQRRTADRDAQKVIVPIFVRIDMGRASPLSAVDAQDVRAAEHIRARHTGRLALRFYSCEMRVARS